MPLCQRIVCREITKKRPERVAPAFRWLLLFFFCYALKRGPTGGLLVHYTTIWSSLCPSATGSLELWAIFNGSDATGAWGGIFCHLSDPLKFDVILCLMKKTGAGDHGACTCYLVSFRIVVDKKHVFAACWVPYLSALDGDIRGDYPLFTRRNWVVLWGGVILHIQSFLNFYYIRYEDVSPIHVMRLCCLGGSSVFIRFSGVLGQSVAKRLAKML